MSKQFWGVVVVVILLFVGVFALTGNSSKNSGSSKSNPNSLTQHTLGKGTGGVNLTEYGDYQCPYCQQYAATVSAVQQKYGDQITLQFRNFPLTNLHPNAFAASRAAEAAGLEGKFWEMHDTLYTYANWKAWTEASDPTTFFNQYAQQIGLNVATFKTDYASSKVNDLINADMAEGNRLKITGTPTFFINGKTVDSKKLVDNTGQPSLEAFSKVIDAALAANTAKQ